MAQFVQNPFLSAGRPQITPLGSGSTFLPTQTMPMNRLSSVGDVQQFLSAYGDYKKRQQMAQPQQPSSPQPGVNGPWAPQADQSQQQDATHQPGVNGPWQNDDDNDPRKTVNSMFASLFRG